MVGRVTVALRSWFDALRCLLCFLAHKDAIVLSRHERRAGGARRGDVLIGGRLGVLQAERDPAGGLDPEAGAADAGPLIGAVTKGVRSAKE